MAQHDYVIANQAFPATRADINDALGAIVSLNSGSSAPSTTYAYMLWLDTTTGTLKQRNAANSGWIVRGTADESFVLSRSSNTILDISDRDKVLIATGSYTQTLDAVATLGDGWAIDVIVDSGVTLTLDPNGSETIDGATTKVIVGPTSGRIVCNGTLLRTIGLESPSNIQLGTKVASTSGTSIDFSSIPAWVRRITINFEGVSTNGTSVPIVQLGDSGGFETSGYSGAYTVGDGAASGSGGNHSSGFRIAGTHAASNVLHGSMILTLVDPATNTWAQVTDLGLSDAAFTGHGGGTKSLSATLDRLRITTTGGTDAFDAGNINIAFE